MLYGLEPGLQQRFERHGAYEMFEELKMVFQAHARVERYEVSDKFYNCKMEENRSVSEHILKMSGLHNRLSQLGVNLPDDAVVDRILQSLPPSYKSFVMTYNMQGMVKTIPEVFAMLKSAEVEIKKEHQDETWQEFETTPDAEEEFFLPRDTFEKTKYERQKTQHKRKSRSKR